MLVAQLIRLFILMAVFNLFVSPENVFKPYWVPLFCV